jgi:hypothetical protein
VDVRRIVQQASQTPAVRRRLRARATQVAARAKATAARQGLRQLSADIRVEEGTRPGTKAQGFQRPYARVVAPGAAKYERGTSRFDKYRLMLRAARAVSSR